MTDSSPPTGSPPAGGFSFSALGPMPKPGEGPTKEERERGNFDILFVGGGRRRPHASAPR